MNKLVIVGSSINPRKGRFTYSATRSKFDAEERFRQTLFTINSLQNSLPDARLIIVDTSDDYSNYKPILSNLKNVEFIGLKEISIEINEIVNTHIHKSYCESLILNTFYSQYKRELLNYDFILKATGRYFFNNLNNNIFTQENKDKIMFKPPLSYEWNDSWGYSLVDRRLQQNNNKLHQYCTVLYGFGISQLDRMIDLNQKTMSLVDQPSMSHYDIETLAYYFTRSYESDILETDWIVSGWNGTCGRYVNY